MSTINQLFHKLSKLEFNNTVRIISPIHGLILGSSLCFAIDRKNYSHIPVIFIAPSIYCGYQLYNNKKELASEGLGSNCFLNQVK